MSVNEKIIIEMGDQIISIEFHFSFLTIYNNIVCTDGKVPAIIMLLYGGISSYTGVGGNSRRLSGWSPYFGFTDEPLRLPI